MKLYSGDAPHIRRRENTRVLMLNAIFPMLIIYASATFYYQARALALLAFSVAAAVITDAACVLVAGKRLNPRDLSPVVTGMIIPLLMPASVDYWIVGVAVVFAIVVAKHPFGGVGHNVFNPAAAGFAFAAICFGDKLFTYPIPRMPLPVFDTAEVMTGISPAFTLDLGATPGYEVIEVLAGNFPGPMGCTNILVILGCLLYLVSRGTVRFVTPVSFFVTAALVAYILPRFADFEVTGELRAMSVLFEMSSGMLFFGGVFMMGDPVTTPKRSWTKAVFSIASGAIAMMFRRYGSFEEGFPFAILLMNATVWGFDMAGEMVAGRIRRRHLNAGEERSPGKKKPALWDRAADKVAGFLKSKFK